MRSKKFLSVLGLSALALAGCSSSESQQEAATPSEQVQSQVAENTRAAETSTSESTPTSAPSSATSSADDSCEDDNCTSLVFTGDFLVHNMLWAQAQADLTDPAKAPMDFAPLIAEQKPYVEDADLAVCQMETNVAPEAGPYSGYPDFNVPPQILRAASETGYDVCMTASNHSIDQKTTGLKRTYQAVTATGMGVTGTNLSAEEAETPDIFTAKNGAKVAIITGTYGLNENVPEYSWQVDMLDPQAMIAKAKKAREMGADIVVANMHAGTEYDTTPNKQQVSTAHQLVDSGEFDLIVGEHAHTVQPVEKYKDTWIVYGMGNNITEISPTYTVNNEGIMVNAILKKDGDDWSVDQLQWASSSMVDTPAYRYCITSPERPASTCIPEAAAQQSNARVQKNIESQGAAEQGLKQWQK